MIVFDNFKQISNLQQKNSEIALMISKAKNDVKDNNMQIYDNLLFNKDKHNNVWRIVVPSCSSKKVIDAVHEKLGHFGIYKTVSYIKSFIYGEV